MNQESQNIEYKESWRDEYLKWVCGFANAHGGTLYIGIDDDGNVVGAEHAKRLSEDIPNKIRDVLGIVAEVNLLGKDANEYIEIRIEPNSFPISYKGEYHIRSGSTKQQLKGNALTQFLLRKTGLSWDATEVSNIELADLSPVAFDIFRTQSVRRKRMDKADVDISDRELLEKLHLFTEDVNPLPKFELSENDVTIVFEKSISDSANMTGKVTGKVTGKATGKSEIIVNTILANPHTTVEDLMELLNMSNTGVRNIMRQLKADGIIKRVGSDKTGHWEVVDKQTEYFTNLLNNNN
ncbi:MAG: putative DNA binding domain-containing protein [Bacteroidales bacterium]|nr:putative DNA binding domain-containing protein [Bacteroidales bacterium]